VSQVLKPKVSIIIPVLHWKRPLNKKRFFMPRQTIVETLADIQKNVKINYEVIVICNGQDPELIDFVKTSPVVNKYSLNSVNVGVARSWNMGAQLAEGEFLCYLNDDVSVGEGGIESLCLALQSDVSIGQVGPVGALWDGSQHKEFVGEHEIADADAIAGFCFMMPDHVFRNVGGFDIHYSPAGLEEIDMCFAIRKAGYRCVVVPKLKIHHYHHHGVSAYKTDIVYLSSTIDTESLHERNKAYFEKKWGISC
jgi:GT2 family glycosyltransferase